MPLNVATILVFALGLVPGALGSYAWAAINGLDWRQKDWESAIRFIAFSVLGLALYGILTLVFDFVPPFHVIPQSYAPDHLTVGSLNRILVPYVGHLVCSGIIGALAALLDRLVCHLTGAASQPSTWDYFLEKCLPQRWSVITLTSGDVYAGFVRSAEHSAAAAERDLVLGQPARLDVNTGNYVVTSYNDLFVPAQLIQSIATVRLDAELQAAPAQGTFLFPEVHIVRQESTQATTGTFGRDPQGRLPTDTTGGTPEGTSASSPVHPAVEEVGTNEGPSS